MQEEASVLLGIGLLPLQNACGLGFLDFLILNPTSYSSSGDP